MESPRLPWEVIERVIEHSGGHTGTLRSLSLTCHQLRPRSRCMIFARIEFKSRVHGVAFVDFLGHNPHLKSFVRSIAAPLTDFAPFPILHILPNLSEVRFTSQKHSFLRKNTQAVPDLHQSTLTCFQRFGTHIQTLCLSDLSFPTYLLLARVLLAFTNIVHLTCTEVMIQTAGNRAPLGVIERRLSEQMRLKTLAIDSQSLTGGDDDKSVHVGALLFDSNLAPPTVESLTLMGVLKSDIFSQRPGSDWSRLRSLLLRFSDDPPSITNALELLANFHGPTLREVVLELEAPSIVKVIGDLSRSGEPDSEAYAQLEGGLLRFSQPGIVWILSLPLPVGRNLFWARELAKHFPLLSQRGTLTLKSDIVFPVGHDAWILALVVSPNSKWVASGSYDSTIIVWDADDGTIAQQWVAHGPAEPVHSLAFSPDSRYLASGGGDGKIVIWDFSGDVRRIATLEGHAKRVWSCAWSPDGSLVASGSSDGTVRLWDAHAFEQLHVLEQASARVRSVTFSPNGRCLASGSSSRSASTVNYCIWDLVSGRLRKPIEGQLPGPTSFRTLAFDPGSVRVAVASGPDAVEIWDVKAGGRLCVLGQGGCAVNDVSFSPDGKVVVVASDNGTVKIWDACTGVERFSLKRHGVAASVSAACFSPCGKYVASASWDWTVRLWRTSDGSCVATFSEHIDKVHRLAFSPDGTTLSSAGEDGTVVIRRMRDIIR